MLQCYYNNLHPAEGKRLILIGSKGTPYLLDIQDERETERFWPTSNKYQHRGDSVAEEGSTGSWKFALSSHDLDLLSGQKLLTSQLQWLNLKLM